MSDFARHDMRERYGVQSNATETFLFAIFCHYWVTPGFSLKADNEVEYVPMDTIYSDGITIELDVL